MNSIPKVAIQLMGGGWCYVHRPDRAHQIWVRVEPDGEAKNRVLDFAGLRFKIAEVHIYARNGNIDTSIIRDLPFSTIESLINSNGAELWEGYGEKVDLETIRRSEISRIRFKDVKRLKLSKPETRKLSDEFLSKVAKFYIQSVQIGEPPIVAISEEAGVPYGTADNWVRKARAKGFLVRGDAGKVS